MPGPIDPAAFEEAVAREVDLRFRSLAAGVKAMIYRVRLPEGRIDFVNDAIRELVGLEPADLLGLPLLHADRLPPQGRAILDTEWPKLLAGDPTPVFDFPMLRTNGELRWVQQGNTVLRDAEGRPVAVQCILSDITEHKHVEEELRRARELLRTVIDQVPGWLALVDRDGRYLVANRKYLEAFGKPIHEIEGHCWWDVFPDLVPTHRPLIDQCMAGKTVVFDDVLPLDPARPTHVHGVYRPVRGADGSVEGLSVLVMDVTDRVEVEEALAAEKERLAVTLGGIADGVISADVQGRVVLMNPVAEELTGWPAGDALGRSLKEVCRTVDREQVPGSPGEEVLPDYRILLRRDGRSVPVVERTSALQDQAGRSWGDVCVFRDVTASLRLRDEAIQSQKLESLAVLAGGLAHDFNNLLTGVLGNVSLVLSRTGLPEETRGWLEDAEAAGVRAQGLTQQLLTFARGGAPIRKVTNLGPAVRQVAAFSSLGSRVACRIEVDPALWPADVDEGQVAQVIQNLVLNAIEAMPEGGEMSVEARNLELPADNTLRLSPGPYLVIRVIDQGVGIPEAVRARIFDPYYSTKQRRSGLGLAVSHSIAVRHGGRIQVDSEVGRGSTFQIFLPALPGAEPEGASSVVPTQVRGGTILVMDDDPLVRRLMERMLARLGHAVASAEDGRQALRMYREAREAGHPYDGVILDLTVPGGMGGVEAMALLREMDPEVRAIVTSGYSDNPVMASFADHGFAAVLPKPFVVERLMEALAAALGGSSTRS